MNRDDAIELHRFMTQEVGIDFVAHLPDGLIEDLQLAFVQDSSTTCISVSNEIEAVGLCAGAWMGGSKPAMIISDSGLIVAAWGLASLAVSYGIPMVVVVAHRGSIGDRNNWRFLTYKFTTEPLLETLQVPYSMASSLTEAKEAIASASLSAQQWQHPIAVLLHGSVLSGRQQIGG
jgi:sulfopyruvate decarboxylase subunit alpha